MKRPIKIIGFAAIGAAIAAVVNKLTGRDPKPDATAEGSEGGKTT